MRDLSAAPAEERWLTAAADSGGADDGSTQRTVASHVVRIANCRTHPRLRSPRREMVAKCGCFPPRHNVKGVLCRRARAVQTRARRGEFVSRAGLSRGCSRLAKKYECEYELSMERITATLDEETVQKIRHVAGPRGVSSFLNQAARERLARLELRGLLDELDAKHGAAPPAIRAEVRRDARRIFRAR